MQFVRVFVYAVCLLLLPFARAEVIYENGAFNGIQEAATISPLQQLSNSFAVEQHSVLKNVTLGLWSRVGSAPVSVTWSIGTTAFGAELGSATVLLTNEEQTSVPGFTTFLSTFTLDLELEAGNYWFTLSNGLSSPNSYLGWDINNGPSQAFYRNNIDQGPAPSEYFRLEGEVIDEPNPLPEPAPLAIFGLGLVCLSVGSRRGLFRVVRQRA